MNNSISRVLCVDDESNDFNLLEAILLPRGYDVVRADTGLEALEKIKTEQIDICLLDVMMPGMDGYEVCRQIKSDDRYRNIPVVLITAHTGTNHRIRGIESGADDFISKPFDSLEVLARIKMLLDVKELRDQLNGAREYAENIIKTVREALLVLDSDLKVLSANHSFYKTFKVTAEKTIGTYLYDLGNGQWNIPALQTLLTGILPNDNVINGYEVEHDFPGVGRKIIELNARQIFRESIGSHIILLAMEDITERRRADDKLHKLSRAVEQSPVSTVITDTQGVIEFVNPAFTWITGYSVEEAVGQNPRFLQSGFSLP
jgi:CheY-like chemotaxis protein